MATFAPYRPREAPAPLPLIPAGMTPLQQRSYLATQGVAGEGGQFGDPGVRDFYLDTLLYNLTDPSGALMEGSALLPIESQYLSQTYGIDTAQGLEGTLNDLIKLSGRTVPETMDLVSRDVEERERGERTGNEPFGDIGVSMSPDVGLSEGSLAGAIAAGLTGALGLGPAGTAIAGALSGQQGVQGPTTPQVGTPTFGQVTRLGREPARSPVDYTEFTGRHPGGMTSGGPGGGGRGGGGGANPGPGQGGPSAGSPAGGAQAAGGHAPGTFHGGGEIPESRKPGFAQDVSETLQEGEYVMSRAAVEAFGKPIFDALNKHAKRKK